jgi:hypothetical protein
MTRDEAVDLLMGRLARRTSTVTQQDVINEMVFVQEFILEEDPTPLWFLLTERATAQTTADEERLPVPADFLLEWEEGALYIEKDDGSVVAMVRDDWDRIKERVTGTGQPEYYDIAGEYFVMRKVPDKAYTMHMRYYAKQASLAGTYGDVGSAVENDWLKYAADLLIAETGVIISNQYLQSPTMVEMFMTQGAKAKDRLIRKDTIMKETNKQRFMEG